MGRYGEMFFGLMSLGRYMEIWGDMGRYGEMFFGLMSLWIRVPHPQHPRILTILTPGS